MRTADCARKDASALAKGGATRDFFERSAILAGHHLDRSGPIRRRPGSQRSKRCRGERRGAVISLLMSLSLVRVSAHIVALVERYICAPPRRSIDSLVTCQPYARAVDLHHGPWTARRIDGHVRELTLDVGALDDQHS